MLKGPQGTLFGRNTIGGAISIVTRDPGHEFRGQADVTTGSHQLLQARASVDLPLTDSLSSSVTFSIKSRDGYLKRVPFQDPRAANADPFTAFASSGYDSDSREGGDDNWNIRAKLKYDAGGAFRATFAADYGHTDSSAMASKLLGVVNIPGPFAGTTNLPGTAFDPTQTTGFFFAGLYNFCIGSTSAQIASRNAQALCGARGTQFRHLLILPPLASVNVDADPNNNRLPWDQRFLLGDKDKSYATGNSFSQMKQGGAAATLEYDVSDNLTLKSVTAVRSLSWQSGADYDGSPLNILQISFNMNQQQFSQEFQVLGSALDDRLKYVGGAYLFKEEGNLHDYVTFDEGLLQVDGPNKLETKNYAAFGQVDWRISDLIGITLGGRYTHETKQFEGGQQDLNGLNYKLFGCADANGIIRPNGAFPLAPVPCQIALGYPDPANPVRVYVPGVNEQKFSNFSPKIGVQLHPNDDVMVYGSYSQGYKTGGWTTRLSNPLPNAPSFGQEKAKTWEAGVKSQLFDRRLQVNAAVFSTRYQGIQLNFQEGVSPTLRNAGTARIKGFEVEALTAQFGGFSLAASLGYINAEYISVLPGVAAVSGPNPLQAGIFVGAPLPKTPDWKFNVSPRYQVDLGDSKQLIVIADWTHTSSLWNDTQRSYALRRPSTDLVNASVTYKANDQWQITAGATNLTDERYLTTGGVNAAAGVIFGSYSRPREWYTRLAVKF